MLKKILPFDLIMQAQRRMLNHIIASKAKPFEAKRRPTGQSPSGKTPTFR
jgi:hypothetical protein